MIGNRVVPARGRPRPYDPVADAVSIIRRLVHHHEEPWTCDGSFNRCDDLNTEAEEFVKTNAAQARRFGPPLCPKCGGTLIATASEPALLGPFASTLIRAYLVCRSPSCGLAYTEVSLTQEQIDRARKPLPAPRASKRRRPGGPVGGD
jgi:hypothetical protein